MITKKFIEDLAISSNRQVESESLERIISTQEDASLRSPGVAAHYYRFLYKLAQEMRPKMTLELGTHTGISAACLAEGYPEGKVITIDVASLCKEECRRPNIEYLKQDSLVLPVLTDRIDILFIDTVHDGVRCRKEYDLYLPFMNRPGLIFFDDITLTNEMKGFWDNFTPIEGEKFELPIHGGAGFGVVLLSSREG